MAVAAEGQATLPADLARCLAEENGERTAMLTTFAMALLRRAPQERLSGVPGEELLAQVQSLLEFVDARRDPVAVRVVPSPLGGTALDVNVPDGPFLVDTVREAVTSAGHPIRFLLHPVIGVERGT